jgi:hypothetical protein
VSLGHGVNLHKPVNKIAAVNLQQKPVKYSETVMVCQPIFSISRRFPALICGIRFIWQLELLLMKLLGVSIAVFILGLLVWGMRASLGARTQSSNAGAAREPVIVELFTSEGCSSCPPADSLLAELDARQPLGSAQVIALEEHVDYWDEQGWKDPFSSASWTSRQYEYAGTLHNGNPYTPQMVVDGTEGFVGSRGGTARQEIEKAAAVRKARVEISEILPAQNKSIAFKVSVEKLLSIAPKDTAEVILAITESGLHSSVKAGENSGEELHHAPVVREWKVIGVVGKNGEEGFTSQPSVKLDAKWNVENLRAVVFVQEKKNRRILGAAAVRLTQ